MWKLRINMGLVLLGLGLALVACQPQAEPAAAVDAASPVLSVLLAIPTATATATAAPPSLPTAPPTLTSMPAMTDTVVPVICVPVQPDGWVLTTVQPGNTLYGLARRGGTTVAELVRVNCRENDILYVGELLYTPPGSGYMVTGHTSNQIIPTPRRPIPPLPIPPPTIPPPPIPPAPPPCETPPCEDDILPTLPPPGENGEPSLLPTAPPDELPLLPTLPPDGNEPAYPAET